jgi:glycosyltransferase involved in cell wall biosynthesis
MTTVSVIIPMYNVESYISGAIRCVLGQSYQDFEVLVVNDGSTDESSRLCTQFDDPRIREIRQGNRGLAGARNTGIRHAQGQYLAFLDADDLWEPEKLARHVKHLESNPAVGVSYCPSRFMDAAGRPMGLVQQPKLTNVGEEDILCRNPVGNGSAPVIRRSVFDEICFLETLYGAEEKFYFDETFRQSEDIECWIRIVTTTAWRFEGIPQPLTWYRANAGGLSANLEAQYESWNRAISKSKGYAPSLIKQRGARARAFQLRYLARRAVHSRSADVAVRLIHRALRTDLRILYLEPGRTLVTLICAWLQYLLPRSLYLRLETLAMSFVGSVNRRFAG